MKEMTNWKKFLSENKVRKPRAAVLFDGAGFARLGLEQAGWECVGFELNPMAHWLSQFVGNGNVVMQDVRTVDLSGFDAVWASPPCQKRSVARAGSGYSAEGKYKDDLLDWSLSIPQRFPNIKYLWVENVADRDWETLLF